MPLRLRQVASRTTAALSLGAASAILLGGCRQDMHDQPRYKPLARSEFFDDRRAARPLVDGTVARGELRDDDHRYSGRIGRELAPSYPFPITAEVLQRGRERYTIYCTPCHGQLGNGEGMVVQRGFKRPTSFHIERLRHAAPGYYFDVMTNGFGAMSDYTAQIPVDDRWAIAAYIRALQISQNTSLADVPEERRGELLGSVGGAAAAQPAPAPTEKAH